MHFKLLIVLAFAGYASAGWYSAWATWGACSVTCGPTYSGTKTRTRYISQSKYKILDSIVHCLTSQDLYKDHWQLSCFPADTV